MSCSCGAKTERGPFFPPLVIGIVQEDSGPAERRVFDIQ